MQRVNVRHRRRRLFFAGIFCCTGLLTGCASGPQLQVKKLTQAELPPSNLVAVFHTAPKRPYRVIARITDEAPEGTAPAQLVAAIQQKAAALGGDAIILRDKSQQVPAQVEYNPAGGQYQMSQAQTVPSYEADVLHWRQGD